MSWPPGLGEALFLPSSYPKPILIEPSTCSNDSRAPDATARPGIPDLLIAAVAERNALTVLHYDKDFDLIAKVTGQSMEWVVPAGSVP